MTGIATALLVVLWAILGHAQMTTLGAGSAPASTVPPTTWNPSDKNAAISLTNSNLSATQNGAASSWRSVRATSSHTTGKYYFELTVTALDGSNGWIGGVADGTESLANYVGTDTHGFSFQAGAGGIARYNGASQGSYSNATLGAGAVLEISVDLDGNLIWARGSNGNGNWNNNASANPATGAGGFSLNIAGGAVAVFPAWSGFDAGTDTGTILTAGAFTGTVPSGFSAWN